MQLKSMLSPAILTSLLFTGTGYAANSDVSKSIVYGIGIGALAKLTGNTAYKDADLPMGVSLLAASVVATAFTCAVCQNDSSISGLCTVGTELVTYCALTKAFPHKKKEKVVVIVPEFTESFRNRQQRHSN